VKFLTTGRFVQSFLWRICDGLGMWRVWGRERCTQGFGEEAWGKRPLGDPDVDGRIILR
jgi:hypothetical protein